MPPILNMACTCPPQSLHGGAPVSISITTHPTDHTSAGAPCVCCLTTSGAIQNVLPAMASPARPPGAVAICSTICFAMPKSASLIRPLFSTKMFAPFTSRWTVRWECR